MVDTMESNPEFHLAQFPRFSTWQMHRGTCTEFHSRTLLYCFKSSLQPYSQIWLYVWQSQTQYAFFTLFIFNHRISIKLLLLQFSIKIYIYTSLQPWNLDSQSVLVECKGRTSDTIIICISHVLFLLHKHHAVNSFHNKTKHALIEKHLQFWRKYMYCT